MKGIVKGILGCTAVASTTIHDARAQYLTGLDRTKFLAGSVSACMRDYGKDDLTRLVPRPLFENYCHCYSNGLADRVSIKDMRADNRVITDPIVREVSKTCYDAMKSEALKQFGRGK